MYFESEREKEFQADCAMSSEPSAGFDLTNHEIMTLAEIRSRGLNQLSQSGAPMMARSAHTCKMVAILVAA